MKANTQHYVNLAQLDLLFRIQAELSPPEFMLLATLTRYADPQGGQCYPGQDTLATQCNMSTRSVRTHLARLEDRGLIESTRMGRQKTNRYRLTLESDRQNLPITSDRKNCVDSGDVTGRNLPLHVTDPDTTNRPSGGDARKAKAKRAQNIASMSTSGLAEIREYLVDFGTQENSTLDWVSVAQQFADYHKSADR